MNLYHFHPGQDLGVLQHIKKKDLEELREMRELIQSRGTQSHEILLVCYLFFFFNYGTSHIL